MKLTLYIISAVLCFAACNNSTPTNNTMTTSNESIAFTSGTQEVNGIKMYYEQYGQGQPLVLLHGGGSTIQTSFGRLIPYLAKHHKLIAIELQAHGRTGDRNAPLSFEQDADDVAALLSKLGIEQADVLGFSNGANTALQLAIRHPQQCRKVIAGSPLLKRNGTFPQFWEFMQNGTFEQMPAAYKEAFMSVTPDNARLLNMYNKCAQRMIGFKDFSDEEIGSVKCPVLLINGDADVATTEHMAVVQKLIPDCRLAIIPGGHGEYLGEITTLKPGWETSQPLAIPLIESFLSKP